MRSKTIRCSASNPGAVDRLVGRRGQQPRVRQGEHVVREDHVVDVQPGRGGPAGGGRIAGPGDRGQLAGPFDEAVRPEQGDRGVPEAAGQVGRDRADPGQPAAYGRPERRPQPGRPEAARRRQRGPRHPGYAAVHHQPESGRRDGHPGEQRRPFVDRPQAQARGQALGIDRRAGELPQRESPGREGDLPVPGGVVDGAQPGGVRIERVPVADDQVERAGQGEQRRVVPVAAVGDAGQRGGDDGRLGQADAQQRGPHRAEVDRDALRRRPAPGPVQPVDARPDRCAGHRHETVRRRFPPAVRRRPRRREAGEERCRRCAKAHTNRPIPRVPRAPVAWPKARAPPLRSGALT